MTADAIAPSSGLSTSVSIRLRSDNVTLIICPGEVAVAKYANPAAESITGFARERLIGSPLLDLVTPAHQQPLENVATIDSDDTEPDSDTSEVFVPEPPLAIGPNVADPAGNLMDQDSDGAVGEATEDRFTTTFEVAVSHADLVVDHRACDARDAPRSDDR